MTKTPVPHVPMTSTGRLSRGVAPAFALTGLVMPGCFALLNSSLRDVLLTTGLTAGLTSGVLLLYRARPMRLALHVLLLCVPIELFYRALYGGPISPGVILAIASTSLREARELLGGHILASVLLIALTTLAIYAAFASWMAENPFTVRRCLVAGVFAILMISGALVIALEQFPSRADLPAVVKDGLKGIFPIDIAYSVQVLVTGLRATRRASAARANFSFQNVHPVNADDLRASPEIYVIVIGEASRRADWSLYGYARSTTPRLDAIRDDLIVFDRVTANATVTILSIPLVLTRATPATFNMVGSEKSLIGLLREGGYKVYWISNQEHYGRNQNPTSAIALEANSVSFPEDLGGSSGGFEFDSNLLKRLNNVLTRSTENSKVVVFLHMMGSHFQYRNRYPSSFDKFHGSDGAPRRLQQWQLQMVNEYDNSVYFTDEILREVIDRLVMCRCNAGLVYFSDHGERLFDHGVNDNEFGHGFPSVSRSEIEVPFFFWLSKSYKDAHPKLVQMLGANTHAAVELDSFFETVVDLAGLTYDGRRATRSLFSVDYQPPRYLDVLNMSAQRVSLPVEYGSEAQDCSAARQAVGVEVGHAGSPGAACLYIKGRTSREQ
jgi:heptose-I-phosphate ethanolaminephosphotransferase